MGCSFLVKEDCSLQFDLAVYWIPLFNETVKFLF